GNGGAISVPNGNSRGGGGGGFLTDGMRTSTCGSASVTPESGSSFLNGGVGGLAGTCSTPYLGGFGGGAGSVSSGWRSSGGGGGYSGGGGGQTNSNATTHSGGGGGSFNTGANPLNALATTTGDGFVTLEVGGINYVSPGSRISPAYDFSKVDPKCLFKSEVSWNATVPSGSSMDVECRYSTDGTTTWSAWQSVLNGGSIPGLTPGMNMNNIFIQTNVTFSNTVSSITPELHALTLEVIDGAIPTALFDFGVPCKGEAIQFTDLSSIAKDNINDWDWDFGDNNNSTNQNPSNTFASVGNYNVTLIVTSDKGCTSQFSQAIYIDSLPVLDIPAGILSRCQGVGSGNYISMAANAQTYDWTITGNNIISPIGTVDWDVNFHGTAEICVTATNTCGTSIPVCLEVVVNPQPETPTTPVGTLERCEGSGVDVYMSSSNFADNFMWTVSGAGNTVSQASPNGTVNWASTFSGTADVCLTTANNCGVSSDVCVSVLVNPLPEVSLPPFSITKFCLDHPAFNMAGLPSGGVFAGKGMTGSSFDAGLAGVGAHLITYTYTDLNGCEGIATVNFEVSACTGIESLYNKIQVYVFPNPTKGNFIIEFNQLDEPAIANLYSISGKLAWSSKINNTRTEVAIPDLVPGMYFLQLHTGVKVEIHKIVVSR
ncbi:MAG: T9SS type A sorting domain-containing protein, partial [Bacteroidetes bacterium]|nr:T9SS type A sorting domain-containing protein [Bacteroidota bacterium]